MKAIVLVLLLAGCAERDAAEQDARSYFATAGYTVLGASCSVEGTHAWCVMRLKDVAMPIPVTCNSGHVCVMDYSP